MLQTSWNGFVLGGISLCTSFFFAVCVSMCVCTLYFLLSLWITSVCCIDSYFTLAHFKGYVCSGEYLWIRVSLCMHLLTHLWWVYRVCWPCCGIPITDSLLFRSNPATDVAPAGEVACWQICPTLHPTLTRSSSFPFRAGVGSRHCGFWSNLFRFVCVLLC